MFSLNAGGVFVNPCADMISLHPYVLISNAFSMITSVAFDLLGSVVTLLPAISHCDSSRNTDILVLDVFLVPGAQ